MFPKSCVLLCLIVPYCSLIVVITFPYCFLKGVLTVPYCFLKVVLTVPYCSLKVVLTVPYCSLKVVWLFLRFFKSFFLLSLFLAPYIYWWRVKFSYKPDQRSIPKSNKRVLYMLILNQERSGKYFLTRASTSKELSIPMFTYYRIWWWWKQWHAKLDLHFIRYIETNLYYLIMSM